MGKFFNTNSCIKFDVFQTALRILKTQNWLCWEPEPLLYRFTHPSIWRVPADSVAFQNNPPWMWTDLRDLYNIVVSENPPAIRILCWMYWSDLVFKNHHEYQGFCNLAFFLGSKCHAPFLKKKWWNSLPLDPMINPYIYIYRTWCFVNPAIRSGHWDFHGCILFVAKQSFDSNKSGPRILVPRVPSKHWSP